MRALFIGCKATAVPAGWEAWAGKYEDIGNLRPDVVVTMDGGPPLLNVAGFDLRRRWIILKKGEDPQGRILAAYEAMLYHRNPNGKYNPLVSVYTAAYNSEEFIRETFKSLTYQTHTNWEWVVVDDGSTDRTWDILRDLAKKDVRVRPYTQIHDGRIGATKRAATCLCRGPYLIELDHDDMLVDTACAEVRAAFETNPEAGMVYSNCCEFREWDGEPSKYPGPVWENRYRPFTYRGRNYLECRTPNVYEMMAPKVEYCNAFTLNVGPNHLRAYRASVLHDLGGYNYALPVADDFDMYARVFLHSKIVHLDKPLYLYRWHEKGDNTTELKRKVIHYHLAVAQNQYRTEFEEKIKTLERWIAADMNPAFKQYWHPKVAPKAGDVVLDCGAFDGEDSMAFARAGATVYAFEPGPKSYQIAKSSVSGAVEVLPYAVSDKKGTARFSLDGTDSGAITDIGLDTVETITIDEWCEKRRVSPTYIKMDIEGSEVAALRGAMETIRKYRPRLAICIYHKPTDPVEVPKAILDACPEYKFTTARHVNDIVLYGWSHLEGFDAPGGHKGVQGESGAYDFSCEGEGVTGEQGPKKPEVLPVPRFSNRVKVCCLAHNEATALPGFFRQFETITDQFYCLDSGSTDGTTEWCKANGVHVEHRDLDRFDNQRNAAMAMGPKTPWIIMLDPDERLSENVIAGLGALLDREDVDIYLSRLWAVKVGVPDKEWPGKRFLFRGDRGLHWIYPVHEYVVGSNRVAMVDDAKVMHILDLHPASRRTGAEDMYARLVKLPCQPKEAGLQDYDNMNDPLWAHVSIRPQVSVIIPAWKRPDLLRKAVASAKDQDVPIEVVVVGDCDPTLNGNTGADVVHNLPVHHGGVGQVPRNEGLKLAHGDWIFYLDDDNCWTKDHVSSMLREAQARGADLVVSSMRTLDGVVLFDRPERGHVDTSCLAVRRSWLAKVGGWREDCYACDGDLVERLVAAGAKPAFTRLPTCLYNVETSAQREFLKTRIQPIPVVDEPAGRRDSDTIGVETIQPATANPLREDLYDGSE